MIPLAKRVIHKEVSYVAPTATLTVYTQTGETFTYTGDGASKADAIAKVIKDHIKAYPGEGFLKGAGV